MVYLLQNPLPVTLSYPTLVFFLTPCLALGGMLGSVLDSVLEDY